MSEVEGVVVLGMHRSGTSLITRLVNLVGMSMCRDDDLVIGRAGNPRGHWEAQSMNAFNDELLGELGARWYCPPRNDQGAFERLVATHGARALATLADAHPSRPYVWKDPRTSILLPFWARVLAGRVAYVLAVRHPFEVCDSLERRDQFAPRLGLALWERYTREGILRAAGAPVVIGTYDEVLAAPVEWCERLAAFLSGLGLPAEMNAPGVKAFVSPGLRHSERSWTDPDHSAGLSRAHRTLARVASEPVWQSVYEPPSLGEETPDTEATFELIRTAGRTSSEIPERAALPTELLSAAATPAARAVGAPAVPVSVILGEAAARDEHTRQLFDRTAPAGFEVLALGGTAVGGVDDAGSRRVFDAPVAGGDVGAYAAAVEAARGRMVVVCTQRLSYLDVRWHERVADAMRPGRVGSAAVGLAPAEVPRLRYWGRRFCDDALATAPLLWRGGVSGVPLLSEEMFAVNREVVVTAGGLDPGFETLATAIAELSLRLWRMGFRSSVATDTDARIGRSRSRRAADGTDLADRIRIASLHLDPALRKRFDGVAKRQPGYEAAHQRVLASELDSRRAVIDAVCARSAVQYFNLFPTQIGLGHTAVSVILDAARRRAGRLRRALRSDFFPPDIA